MSPTPKVARLFSTVVITGGLAVFCIGLMGLALMALWYYTHPMVAMVNASEHRSLRVFVDDVLLVGDLRQGQTEPEAQENFVRYRLTTGSHHVMVLDGRGQMVEERTLVLQRGQSYLYAPAHAERLSWTVQVAEPRLGQTAETQTLSPTQVLWSLPMRSALARVMGPDCWFQEAPGHSATPLLCLRQLSAESAPVVKTASLSR